MNAKKYYIIIHLHTFDIHTTYTTYYLPQEYPVIPCEFEKKLKDKPKRQHISRFNLFCFVLFHHFPQHFSVHQCQVDGGQRLLNLVPAPTWESAAPVARLQKRRGSAPAVPGGRHRGAAGERPAFGKQGALSPGDGDGDVAYS